MWGRGTNRSGPTALVGGTGLRAARAECIGLRAAGAHFLQPQPRLPTSELTRAQEGPCQDPHLAGGETGQEGCLGLPEGTGFSVAEASSFLAGLVMGVQPAQHLLSEGPCAPSDALLSHLEILSRF